MYGQPLLALTCLELYPFVPYLLLQRAFTSPQESYNLRVKVRSEVCVSKLARVPSAYVVGFSSEVEGGAPPATSHRENIKTKTMQESGWEVRSCRIVGYTTTVSSQHLCIRVQLFFANVLFATNRLSPVHAPTLPTQMRR